MKDLIKFVDFLTAFAGVKRANKLKGKGDFENDAEHSFQLAMTSWYLADTLRLEVNKERVFAYALAHDLVETYAGDVDAFNVTSGGQHDSKEENEKKALENIKQQFPEFPSLHQTIASYEMRGDTESKLVYLTDKLLPDINILLSNDSYYRDREVTHDAWEKWWEGKLNKLESADPKVVAFFKELIALPEHLGQFHQR